MSPTWDAPRRLWLLACLLALAAGLSWLAGDVAARAASPANEPVAGVATPDAVEERAAGPQAAALERRRVELTAGDPRRERRLAPALVTVRGRVLRSGQPLAHCDLSFFEPGEAWRDRAVDWALTDCRGRYEVALPAASYLVGSDAASPCMVTVLVPAGGGEIVVDLELIP